MLGRFLGYQKGMSLRFFIPCIVGVFFCNVAALGQKDTIPPTMTSNKLITLDDYRPEAAYGRSYLALIDQESEKAQRKTFFQRTGAKLILPSVLIAYGTAARFNQLPIRQFDFDIDHEVVKRVHRTYRIDDYFEFGMPIVAYGLGFIPGIKAKHNFGDRTFIMTTSLFFTVGAVGILKKTVPLERPYGGAYSFPSGHTAITMMSAHILFKEYKDTSPWIGVGGYLMATTTGVFRMLNRAHWISDVAMGAGIGLLGAEVGYWMLPVWRWIFSMQDGGQRFAAIPTFNSSGFGLGMVYQF